MSGGRHQGRLGRHSVWLLAARVGSQGALVLFSVVIARRLGATGFGEYAFVASIVFVANVLTSFGTDMLLVREIAAGRGTAMAPAALALQLVLSAAIAAVLTLAAPLIPGQSAVAVAALRIALVALLPLAPYTVLSAMLRGAARMGAYALLNLAVGLIQLVTALVLVPPGGTVLDVAVVILATQCVAAVAAAVACGGSGVDASAMLHDPRPGLRKLTRASAPIAVLGALGMLYQRAPILLASIVANATVTGWLSAAMRTLEAAKTIHVAAWGALYPALAEERGAASPPADERMPRSIVPLLGLSVITAAAVTVLADPVVPLVFGAPFAPAVGTVRILAWTLVPYTIASHRSLVLVASRREGEVARALALAVAALVVSAGLSIPSSGAAGAASSVLAAECVQALALSAPWRSVPRISRAGAARSLR